MDRALVRDYSRVPKKRPLYRFSPKWRGVIVTSLSIDCRPNRGHFTLGLTIKEPGAGRMRLVDVAFGYDICDAIEGPDGSEQVDAYERL